MNDIITLDMYFTDFSTKEDRRKTFASEFTQEIQNNAIALLAKVNALLNEFGIKSAQVTSGWRPASLNNKVTNAAKKSYHMLGLAVDILDNKTQDLAQLIAAKPEILKKYDLWEEDFHSTRGINTCWVHLDCGVRQDRPSRMFKP